MLTQYLTHKVEFYLTSNIQLFYSCFLQKIWKTKITVIFEILNFLRKLSTLLFLYLPFNHSLSHSRVISQTLFSPKTLVTLQLILADSFFYSTWSLGIIWHCYFCVPLITHFDFDSILNFLQKALTVHATVFRVLFLYLSLQN